MQKVKCGHCKSDEVSWTESALPNGTTVYLLVCKACQSVLAAAPSTK
jgi:hypothetical protein